MMLINDISCRFCVCAFPRGRERCNKPKKDDQDEDDDGKKFMHIIRHANLWIFFANIGI